MEDLNEPSWYATVLERLRGLFDLIEHDLRHLPFVRSIRVAATAGEHQCSGKFAAVLPTDPTNFLL
jgi:hypothetical protein